MKKTAMIAATAVICAVLLALSSILFGFWSKLEDGAALKVGFVYSGDEITPETYNFVLAQKEAERTFGSRIESIVLSNVNGKEIEEPLRDLARKGCGIIFISVDTDLVKGVAEEYPGVEFCQVSGTEPGTGAPKNYHTFNGEIYQARYVSGVAAGMKLREMIDSGELQPEEAAVGFVGYRETPEVISAFTAFFLGVRSEAPEAVMRVRYTGTRSSYSQEKKCARELINEGCVIISQCSATAGPAAACLEASGDRTIYHVGNHKNMIEEAPACSLISVRVNWSPYVTGAVKAVMDHQRIEKAVKGKVNGNDIRAGLENGWAQVTALNAEIAAEGTAEKLKKTADSIRTGKLTVFKGNYTGTDPDNPEDRIDLNAGFEENRDSSVPSFHFILDGCITVE